MDGFGDFLIEECEDIDGDLSKISTQTLFYPRQNDRFGQPVSESEILQNVNSGIPNKTKQNNAFAMNVWRYWAFERNSKPKLHYEEYHNVPVDISVVSEKELNFWLCRFIMEARRADGSEYPPNTLYNIACGIQRHLRVECQRSEISFFKKGDAIYSSFRATLDGKMKQLTSTGRGVIHHTDNITIEDENSLWNTGVINKTTSKGLSYGIFFYNSKIFGFRGFTEHRNAMAEQYIISTESNGNKVLTYQEHFSKTMQGGIQHRKLQPKCIKQHSDPTNDRDVVELFETYLKLIPCTGPLYRRPNLFYKNAPKFSTQPVGVNTLGKYMCNMFQEAQISLNGRKITNHSGRVYCCTTLYNNGFSDQEIMARSGHRSDAVRTYKRPSDEMLKNVSATLQPPKLTKTEKVEATSGQHIKSEMSEKENVKPAEDEESVLTVVVPQCVSTVLIKKGKQQVKVCLE